MRSWNGAEVVADMPDWNNPFTKIYNIKSKQDVTKEHMHFQLTSSPSAIL